MENIANIESIVQPQRPQMLKVLCILSFIMCGIMILFGALGVVSAFSPSEMEISMQEQQLEMIQQSSPDEYEAALNYYESAKISAIIGFIAQLLSLVAVIFMWKLKKIGFYLYTFAELFTYITTIIFSGVAGLTAITGALGENVKNAVWILAAIMIIVDIVFVILYALNLKHMK